MRSSLLFRRWRRVLLTLIPLALALLHVSAAMPLPLLERLDQFIYDARLRLGMSRTLDERIVIVDIDEKSIDRIGRWPWGRDKLADLTQELFARQRVSVVGFDVVFAERDNSSGLASLRALERGPLAKTPGFAEQLARLAPSLDHDALFARSLHGHAAVLGYYFTSDRQGHTQGALPLPRQAAGSHHLEWLRSQSQRIESGCRSGWVLQYHQRQRRSDPQLAVAGRVPGALLRISGPGDVPLHDGHAARRARLSRHAIAGHA